MTISKKMAACTFYQNALWASSKTTEKKMPRKTPKDIKLYKEKNLLSYAFFYQKTPNSFLKQLLTLCTLAKCMLQFLFYSRKIPRLVNSVLIRKFPNNIEVLVNKPVLDVFKRNFQRLFFQIKHNIKNCKRRLCLVVFLNIVGSIYTRDGTERLPGRGHFYPTLNFSLYERREMTFTGTYAKPGQN